MNLRTSNLALAIFIIIGPFGFDAYASVPGSATFHAAEAQDSVVFTPDQVKNRYIGDFMRWAAEDEGASYESSSVLAIGSSSMRMWNTIEKDLEPLNIIHRGFGGSTMKDVVIFKNFFDRYPSNRILVYEGDNDLAGKWNEVDRDFIEPVKQFIEHVQKGNPRAEIYFISAKPSVARKKAMERYSEANAKLAAICAADDRLHFINVYDAMLNEAGEPLPDIFKGDRLHMNADGYAIWTEIIRKAFGLSERVNP